MHELDSCVIANQKGERIAGGFVSEYDKTILKICVKDGVCPEPARELVIYVYNRMLGECVYKGVVLSVERRIVTFYRVELVRTTQKRDNTRVEKTLRYRITHRFAGKGQEKLEKPIDITILNLSAQGMYISCDKLFAAGHRFPLVFREAGRPISLNVEVIRVEKYRRCNNYGCRFIDISQKDADNIFRYVLHEQIEQRRRNLII